ncbi:hypothetical protein CYMTET_40234 [Cymbomonas tetramitiformis]|uniref:Uncharacterized protein n=1 Tax=Cymbomonas tetramitiformis TaxID=36881 RepID=A0AAE0C8F8_9CHLO|nr:hypothetical protein CYMTET_40234 [Cymbomonas tetramitiformis]
MFYAPVVINRLLLHDRRAGTHLPTIQQWVRECYARNLAGTEAAGGATALAAAQAARGHEIPYEAGKHVSAHALTTDAFAVSNLAEIAMDLKRQLNALTNKIDSHGFTPRAKKPDPRSKIHRLVVSPIEPGGSWSQGLSKRVAFDKTRAEFIPARLPAQHVQEDGRQALAA